MFQRHSTRIATQPKDHVCPRNPTSSRWLNPQKTRGTQGLEMDPYGNAASQDGSWQGGTRLAIGGSAKMTGCGLRPVAPGRGGRMGQLPLRLLVLGGSNPLMPVDSAPGRSLGSPGHPLAGHLSLNGTWHSSALRQVDPTDKNPSLIWWCAMPIFLSSCLSSLAPRVFLCAVQS